MKRIGILLTVLFIASLTFAQKGKVTSALSYKDAGELEKAWETIEQTIDPENSRSKRSIDWPRTWEARGEILREIHRKGKTDIVDEPLFKALESFKKGIELDDKDRFTKSIVVKLKLLQIDLSNYAIKNFQSENFDTALKSFEKYLEISNIPAVKESMETEVLDTAIIYNTGLTAYKAENWEKAIEYFEQSAEVGYNGPESYQFSYNSYQAMGDSAKAVKVLKEGFEKYPDSETLIVQLINYYIETGNANDAIIYLDKAIEQNPENVSYYVAKGSTLEKLGKEDQAIKVYQKAIEKDSTLFTPYYNLGVIHYNNGVAVMNEASQLPPNSFYNHLIEYVVKTNKNGFDVTYINKQGNTEQKSVKGNNWSTHFESKPNSIVSLSAQTNNKNDVVNVKIIHQNDILEEAKSEGDFVVASASGKVPTKNTERIDMYEKMLEEGKQYLEKALPYMEKAYEIDSTEMAIMESLRQIYYRLKMNDKYDEMNEKIKSISK